MVIHAVYENGVFRPTAPVELPERCRVELVISTEAAEDDGVASATPLANLAAMATQFPDNPRLSADLAKQHDHYLYGAPKRP
jgi:predicted DNA-binding antitoxin AbrB/MazE fold protein